MKVVIVHGCPSTSEDLSYNKHWIPWIKEKLEEKGIKVYTPLIPEPWAPVYENWKKEFNKLNFDEDSILIGHSCGCAFLVRWLGETKRKIEKLILVAPWKIPGEESDKEFYTYPIDITIKDRVNKIVMFTADDEELNGKKSLELFHKELGGEIIELKGRGHYTQGDMGTQEFSELLEEVLKTK